MVFREPLQSLQAEEGASVTLRCELSQPNATVVWSKGGLEVQADGRREPRQQGPTVELVLRDLRREDAGEYACACGPQATSATLTVTGGPQGETRATCRTPVLWGCASGLQHHPGHPMGNMSGLAASSALTVLTIVAEILRLPVASQLHPCDPLHHQGPVVHLCTVLPHLQFPSCTLYLCSCGSPLHP